jgi:CO dehydrogenase maturation factor
MKPRVVAVCGKGGVGKTTLSALLARWLRDRSGLKTLLIDADPAGGLTLALGLPVKRTLNQVRKQTIRELKRGSLSKKHLAESLDWLLFESLAEKDNLALLALGRPEESGCYCAVNNLLREAIALLADSFEFTLIDAEAGIEQVNRKVMSRVDYLLLVSDCSAKGLRVAETIRKVAGRSAGKLKAGLVLNRAGSAREARQTAARTPLKLIGWIPEDETIRQFDQKELSFFKLPECPAERAVLEIIPRLGIESRFLKKHP